MHSLPLCLIFPSYILEYPRILSEIYQYYTQLLTVNIIIYLLISLRVRLSPVVYQRQRHNGLKVEATYNFRGNYFREDKCQKWWRLRLLMCSNGDGLTRINCGSNRN